MEVSGHFQTHRSLQVQFCEYPKWTFWSLKYCIRVLCWCLYFPRLTW
jgi:hypothetical protein